jgi:hypothetical protein
MVIFEAVTEICEAVSEICEAVTEISCMSKCLNVLLCNVRIPYL